MAFHVFPAVPNAPMSLGAGVASEFFDFDETAAGSPPAMFVRIVKLGRCSPPGGPPPTLRVRADSGSPVEVKGDPEVVSVFNRPDPSDGPVATASLFLDTLDVYVIKLVLRRAGSRWQLQIRNNDPGERLFTWVVADNDAESKQPWINLPQSVAFRAVTGSPVTEDVEVANLGTGVLSVSLGGLATGSRFQITGLPGPVLPNTCGRLVIKFNAPSTAGTTQDEYVAKTNDTRASPSAGHNDRVTLRAETTTPPDDTPPVDEPAPSSPCRSCDVCPDFLPPTVGFMCTRAGCGHHATKHLPI